MWDFRKNGLGVNLLINTVEDGSLFPCCFVTCLLLCSCLCLFSGFGMHIPPSLLYAWSEASFQFCRNSWKEIDP